MLKRLIAAFVGVTVLLIVLFGAAGGYSVTALLEDEEQRQVDRSVLMLATVVGEHLERGDEVTAALLRRHLAAGERAEYSDAGGDVVAATRAGGHAGETDGEIRGMHRLADGGTVTLSRSTAHVEALVGDALLTIVLVGLVLVLLAAVLGVVVARRMSQPFQDLALLAGEFGRGRFDVDVPNYSIPEAEDIGRAIREAQRELTGLIGRERAFATNASHQLKTPLTALRLNLEDLALWPQTAPEVAEELTRGVSELDRLGITVNDLLELAHDRRVGAVVEIDLCALVRDIAQRWRPRVEADSRRLVDLTPGEVMVRLTAGPLSQILDALVLNAVTHGAGEISIAVAALDNYVRVQVSDQREATTGEDDFARPTGGSRRGDIDLSVAAEIAKGFGGYLRLEAEPPMTFSLMLPRSRPLA